MSTSPPPAPPARIAISVGDVAGVGPELALQAIANPTIRSICTPVLFAPADVLSAIGRKLDLPVPDRFAGDAGLLAAKSVRSPVLIDTGDMTVDQHQFGRFDAVTGRASHDAVCAATDAAIAGDVAAIVTGPIQKEAWQMAGIAHPGHTELLAEMTGQTEVRMMLTSPNISCVLATIHIPLADVSAALTTQVIVDSIRLGGAAMTAKLARPARITVCGLNPHAGEHGMFSHGEEAEKIIPAIEACQRMGFDLRGPLPPDTAFTPAMRAKTDVYICMYHDQGLIPLKALAFDDAVNVTLGLPIIRTSVDHGTALDLAGTGVASVSSFIAAINLAVDLVEHQGRQATT